MSALKDLNKNLYPCINDAVLEILDEHIVSSFGSLKNHTPIYGSKALDEVLEFLAFNNIQHQYKNYRLPMVLTVTSLFLLFGMNLARLAMKFGIQRAPQIMLTVFP